MSHIIILCLAASSTFHQLDFIGCFQDFVKATVYYNLTFISVRPAMGSIGIGNIVLMKAIAEFSESSNIKIKRSHWGQKHNNTGCFPRLAFF